MVDGAKMGKNVRAPRRSVFRAWAIRGAEFSRAPELFQDSCSAPRPTPTTCSLCFSSAAKQVLSPRSTDRLILSNEPVQTLRLRH